MEVANESPIVFRLELDEKNYLLMRKVMNSYCESINAGRAKKRTQTTKPQKRTQEDLIFKFKLLQ